MVFTGTNIVRDHDSLTHLGWANSWSGATHTEARANAQLMAAAPELLAAAEALVADAESWETIYTNPNVPQTAAEYVDIRMAVVDQLRAAIRKAKGGD
jgi:hypothetical protein